VKEEFVQLGDLVEIKGGVTPSRAIPEYWTGNIPWATVKDLKSTTLDSTEENISESGVENSATTIVPKNTVVIATRMGLGKAAINTVPIAINQDLKALVIKDGLDPKFLLHFILSQAALLESYGKGATVKGITVDVIKKLKIPRYTIAEQRRIAAILNKADNLRRKRAETIKMLDQFLSSVFLEMFDKYCNPTHSESLNAVCEVLVYCRNKTAPYETRGIPLIRTGNFRNGKLDLTDLRFISKKTNEVWSARYQPKPTDIVYCREAPFGMAAMIPKNFYPCLGQGIMVAKANDKIVSRNYLLHALNSKFVFRQAREVAVGATVKHMRVQDVEKLQIPVPPLVKQNYFSDIVSLIDKLTTNLMATEKISANFFASLTQRAFRGEL
jgi:type I restriction enzyme S subunit